MTFDELLELVTARRTAIGLCADSRKVSSGDIFVAIEGPENDGHDFIDQAIEQGAKFIVYRKPQPCSNAETIIVKNPAKALALLAQARFANPSAKLTNLAVTGTNGKTTIGFLVRSIIQTTGKKCGLIGTILYDTSIDTAEAPLTTPDSTRIAELADKMTRAGAEFMAIEASSHSLAQNRLAGIDFTAAAFTNLTGDHLDYHKTAEEYLAAKTRLFKPLAPDATAVLNAQSPASKHIAQKTKAKILWYAVDADADISARIESMDINETVYTLEYAGQKQKVKTTLIGRHNISNHLAAAGLCLAAGFGLPAVAAGLSAIRSVPGRLEYVNNNANFTVLIDYAHTDDALKNVLSTLRPLCKGQLTVVFGCGGDRDKTKRPRMAKVAQQLADFVIVTSDNPRTEPPNEIIEDIIAGFTNFPNETITIEPDRKNAIKLAITAARKNDIILIAGKGHEKYQIIGKEKFDFDDKKIAENFLEKIK